MALLKPYLGIVLLSVLASPLNAQPADYILSGDPDLPDEICTIDAQKAKAIRAKYPEAIVPYDIDGETVSEADKETAVAQGYLAISRIPDVYLDVLFGDWKVKAHVSRWYWGGGSAGMNEVYTTACCVVHELGHVIINHFLQDERRGAAFYEDLKSTFVEAAKGEFILEEDLPRYKTPAYAKQMDAYFRSSDGEFFAEGFSVYYCDAAHRSDLNPVSKRFFESYFAAP